MEEKSILYLSITFLMPLVQSIMQFNIYGKYLKMNNFASPYISSMICLLGFELYILELE